MPVEIHLLMLLLHGVSWLAVLQELWMFVMGDVIKIEIEIERLSSAHCHHCALASPWLHHPLL